MTTHYKDIPWYEWLYAITTNGRVWSYPKRIGMYFTEWNYTEWRYIKPLYNRWGYMYIRLRKNNKSRSFLVHRLVAFTYVENPHNKRFINHKNWVKDDNRVENLEWCTSSENNLHSYRVLGKQVTESQRIARGKVWLSTGKKVMQLTKEWILCRIYKSASEACRITWISNATISACARKEKHNKNAGWYKWEYLI